MSNRMSSIEAVCGDSEGDEKVVTEVVVMVNEVVKVEVHTLAIVKDLESEDNLVKISSKNFHLPYFVPSDLGPGAHSDAI